MKNLKAIAMTMALVAGITGTAFACFLSSENPHFHHENSPSSSGKFPYFQRGHQDAVLTAASCRMSACSMR